MSEEKEFIDIDNTQENQPILKPTKKPITELKQQQLVRAREAALIKKHELKELNLKSRNLKLEESKLKAFQYDELMKEKEQIMNKAKEIKKEEVIITKEEIVTKPDIIKQEQTPKKKRIIKKIIYEDDSEEEVEVLQVEKHKPQNPFHQQPPYNPYTQQETYSQLIYQNACEKIQSKLHDERAKALIYSLMPSYH